MRTAARLHLESRVRLRTACDRAAWLHLPRHPPPLWYKSSLSDCYLADCLPWGVDWTVGIVVDAAACFLLTHRSAAQHSPYLSALAANGVAQGVCLTASDCV